MLDECLALVHKLCFVHVDNCNFLFFFGAAVALGKGIVHHTHCSAKSVELQEGPGHILAQRTVEEWCPLTPRILFSTVKSHFCMGLSFSLP
jgi:hypothetical protein